MKKNPFILNKRIIIGNNEIGAFKGGVDVSGTDDTIGGISVCKLCPETEVCITTGGVCEPTCIDGEHCDNSGSR